VIGDVNAMLLCGVLGLAVGSFLNVCIHRLPRRESISRPPSHCPACKRPLAWIDNVPIVSYLALKGRCRQCGARISPRYLLVELMTAAMFVAACATFEPGWLLAARLVFGCAMIVLFMIDLEHQLLPNVITLPGILAGLAFSLVAPPGLRDSLIGLAVGGGILFAIAEGYYRLRGEEGMGMGDVKMLAMIGAFLGWQLTIVTFVLSSIAGACVGLLVIASKRGDMKYALPFGTFLASAALVASLAGDRIVAWYLSRY
jgi:leader peptidase (prepilin peptidase)/N-methyltransferase